MPSHPELLAELDRLRAEASLGGGAASLAKHRAKGKLTARDRIAYLVDAGTPFTEIGALAAMGMYEEQGGCPAAGVVIGVGRVSGRLCVIVANDATVKAGAWFPMTGKKNLRAQEIAMENNLPILYLVDSAGVFLPMQDEIFPDKEHFGRIFRNNAVMSARGIPQLAAIMGPCVAGGAYLPIMSDEAIIVDGTGSLFLAGPYLVKSAIGEDVDIETLGGAATHSQLSGVTDYQEPNDTAALDRLKRLVGRLGHGPRAGFDRVEPLAPETDAERIFDILPVDRSKPYDAHALLKCLVDAGSIDEYKEGYGKTLVTAYARIDGWAVGVVMNQRTISKSKKGEMQIGGVIYSDSADKAARFVMNCNQKRIPLLFLQDVSGFMVGSRSEHGGIIKDGAKLVSAVANSVVPKFTVIVGNSFGAGNYAMCGKAYDPRLMLAWPTAQIAVMGGAQAAKTLMQIQAAALEKKGVEVNKEVEAKLFNEVSERYTRQMAPTYAAARLWIDAIIDPRHTRQVISTGIEMANHNPHLLPFSPGVIQT
jgi:3-methylcrotonyl-CoA carboxylase beta subunit